MNTRIALIGIIVEEHESVSRVNELLHEFSSYVVGRMGVPYRERGLSIISLVLDAPESALSALAGRLGQVPGVSAKTMLAKTGGKPAEVEHERK